MPFLGNQCPEPPLYYLTLVVYVVATVIVYAISFLKQKYHTLYIQSVEIINNGSGKGICWTSPIFCVSERCGDDCSMEMKL